MKAILSVTKKMRDFKTLTALLNGLPDAPVNRLACRRYHDFPSPEWHISVLLHGARCTADVVGLLYVHGRKFTGCDM